MRNSMWLLTAFLALLAAISCARRPEGPIEIFHDSISAASRIVDASEFDFVADGSSDGDGCLRVKTSGSRTLSLFLIDEPDVEETVLYYTVRARTENLMGKVYVEMLCNVPGRGEFFSRGLRGPISGTTGWTSLETPFILKKGDRPDRIRLNVVIQGSGVVWLDDARVYKTPLP